MVKQIILAERPKGEPNKEAFKMEERELPELKDGEVLLTGKFYSVDPYMRGRMSDSKSYVAPFEVGEPISGGVVAQVEESKSSDFAKGDYVIGNLPWATQTVAEAKELRKVGEEDVPLHYYLGVLGMPGLTAYFGLMDIGQPKEGETVVVSGAAGAVGLVVGQIAKIQGCKVVGIAGSDEKIEMLKSEFGYDEGINYKTAGNMQEAVKKACPDGVDIYYDNVGGEVSDGVIMNLNFHARIPLCGQISLYNSKETPTGPRIQPMLLTRSVLMKGFIVSNYQDKFPEGMRKLGQWIREGNVKFTETIVEGFDKLPEAFLGLFSGKNQGKMIVQA
ncbi:NADP-dependent oxidoreductase [Fulvivirga sediminis]|uniref:NADP-dependent oxidoreductase n=1 Tax=Fulvivirga sediminis TaxID=2803949 RepID=A0A937F7R1_9BACT|nr:NADP-dependent oxidoreductase [Fulvivirga sediminis]MBL3656596.1 NADP-dependent oxidoreductase [Fulvivirga sediminis]